MALNLIVAKSKDNIIGVDYGRLPWKLKNDLIRFKSITTGNIVIMGRKTFDSIGHPLQRRENIVITTDNTYSKIPGIITFNDIEQVKEYIDKNIDKEIFIIGGGIIYEIFLPFVQKIYLTEVDVIVGYGTKFPELDMNDWRILEQYNYVKDDNNEYNYSFINLERKHE